MKFKFNTTNTLFLNRVCHTTYLALFYSLIVIGCRSTTYIKQQSIAIVKKEFKIVKEDILKKFNKVNQSTLYTSPKLLDYLNYALWHNKEIDMQISKLLKTYSNIKTIYYDDPSLGITFAPIYGIFRSGGPLTREFMFSQVFPTIEKLSLERKSIHKEFKSQYYNTLNSMLEIQNEITINLILWEKLETIKNIKREKILLLKKTKQYLSTSLKFSKETMVFQGIIQINLNISKLKKEILDINSKIANIQNILAAHLYIKNYKSLKLPDLKIIKKLDNQKVPKNFRRSPFLMKYKEIINKSAIEINRATRNFIPDIGLTLGFTFKSMDPVDVLMGNKGLLSSLMMNLPIYQEKLKAILSSSIYENFATKYEYDTIERTLLKNYINNEVETNISSAVLSVIEKEIKEIKKLKNYITIMNKLGNTTYVQNLEIHMILLDYQELYTDVNYNKTIKRLENRFLIGKFILGANK